MLDTSIASHVIKGDVPRVRERLVAVPMASVAVSAVTQAELLFGAARRGWPTGLTTRLREFLVRVAVLPWTAAVGEVYATLRATAEARGTPLAPLDMMIAAHAVAVTENAQPGTPGAILVTADRAFRVLNAHLAIEDWTQAKPTQNALR